MIKGNTLIVVNSSQGVLGEVELMLTADYFVNELDTLIYILVKRMLFNLFFPNMFENK